MGSMKFSTRIIDWQRTHGRHQLPWQQTRDPYRVWLSEIMLQQTQVSAVIPYYEKFIARFPDIATLAGAPVGEVMAHWAGLGYYARARNLHACAQAVMQDWGGRFPAKAQDLASLPGIGRSTAGAIAAFCAGERAAILDGNVRRVLSRHFAIEGLPAASATLARLWSLAESLLPPASTCQSDPQAMASYTQGLMDLGATVCTRSSPNCAACPLAGSCIARAEGRIKDFPAARVRRATPEREVAVLIARHADRFLLEQRPPNGIWGGLWSLPEFIPGENVQSVCDALGIRPAAITPMASFAHTFTHFRLILHPTLVRVDTPPAESAAETSREWIPAQNLDKTGMAAPVRKLLLELVATNPLAG